MKCVNTPNPDTQSVMTKCLASLERDCDKLLNSFDVRFFVSFGAVERGKSESVMIMLGVSVS